VRRLGIPRKNAHGILSIGGGKDQRQRLLAGSIINGGKLPGFGIKDLKLIELRRRVLRNSA
jgi:hypothetical protein